ncbi:hypothetical protein TrRE_jg4926 [Triparma retinervis]|uniref:PIH1D1/2/3 CS-like domain-containing protein n=1 Tax=Triparma retinervis TaxID=2557542 RepID=A0A9W7CEE0_9STRA|nr:hypothetical protein TrRE_jg4926 [Triparma retinervis]
MSGYGDITALSNMLQETNNGNEEEEAFSQAKAFAGPSSAVAPKPTRPVAGKEKKEEEGAGDIWSVDEVPDEEGLKLANTSESDTRAVPQHEIYHKQDVDSSDVYLGLSDKTPGSADCTHLVIKAHFPSHKLSDIDLDVTKNTLTAMSDKYKLKLYLPQPVDPDKGSAKFDSKSGILAVEVPVLEKEWE